MHVRPAGFDDTRIGRLLAEHWGFAAIDLRYAPVGYGSHHWVATAAGGERRFVTVDELAPAVPAQRLGRLRAALHSAIALRDDGGLEFVVAPLHAADGAIVVTLDDVYAVTVLPFVDGRPWSDGDASTGASRAALLARLHDAAPAAAPHAGSAVAWQALQHLLRPASSS